MKLKIFFLILLFECYISAQSTEQVFTSIYSNAFWGTNAEGDGWSGIGSSYEATAQYREFIADFLKNYAIRSVVDLGCGDWEFSRYIDWKDISYLGIDIVEHVIEKNKKRFEADNVHFEHSNALKYDLPYADLLICKEVLQHLSNDDIRSICSQFKKYKYCLITNGIDYETMSSDNREILCGDYRPLDLTLPPFNIVGTKIFTFYSAGFLKQTLLIIN